MHTWAALSPTTAMIVLVLVFFFTHYLFASITAHTTAMLPVMLAVGADDSRHRRWRSSRMLLCSRWASWAS